MKVKSFPPDPQGNRIYNEIDTILNKQLTPNIVVTILFILFNYTERDIAPPLNKKATRAKGNNRFYSSIYCNNNIFRFIHSFYGNLDKYKCGYSRRIAGIPF